MLIDEAKVYVKGGSGGNGCNSLHKDIFNRRSVPDGGPGGDGGDVVLESDTNLQTLLDFKYNQHYRAGNGGCVFQAFNRLQLKETQAESGTE